MIEEKFDFHLFQYNNPLTLLKQKTCITRSYFEQFQRQLYQLLQYHIFEIVEGRNKKFELLKAEKKTLRGVYIFFQFLVKKQ